MFLPYCVCAEKKSVSLHRPRFLKGKQTKLLRPSHKTLFQKTGNRDKHVCGQARLLEPVPLKPLPLPLPLPATLPLPSPHPRVSELHYESNEMLRKTEIWPCYLLLKNTLHATTSHYFPWNYISFPNLTPPMYVLFCGITPRWEDNVKGRDRNLPC